jgi:hypothetical protein
VKQQKQKQNQNIKVDLLPPPPLQRGIFLCIIRLELLSFMPRNQLNKEEFKVRVLKLKYQVDQEPKTVWQGEKNLAHKYLNKVLDALDEYRL